MSEVIKDGKCQITLRVETKDIGIRHNIFVYKGPLQIILDYLQYSEAFKIWRTYFEGICREPVMPVLRYGYPLSQNVEKWFIPCDNYVPDSRILMFILEAYSNSS